MKDLVFVTGNKHKLEIAQSVLGLYDINVKNIDLNVDEVQSEDIEQVAIKSALKAAKELNTPVIKTDVGFEIEALNGFPGAFGKYVFKWLETDGILKLLEDKENRNGKAIEVLAYATPSGDYKTFKTETKFTIRMTPKGEGSTMDKLMEIKGQKDNYGSLSLEEKLKWWKKNNNYFHEFAKWYVNKGE